MFQGRDPPEGGRVFLSLALRVQGFLSRPGEALEDEAGAVAVEYVLLLIFVAVAIVAAATTFGIVLGDKYKEVCAPLSSGAAC
jgi:Flp pilus assembly pilin Flp